MAESVPLHVRPEQAAAARALAPVLAAMREVARAEQAVALFEVGGPPPPVGELAGARRKLGAALAEVQKDADLAGRREVVEAARRLGDVAPPGAVSTLPAVPPTASVADLASREAVLAVGAEEVQAAYNERHAFALARSTSAKVTERAQKAITRGIARGLSVRSQVDELLRIADKDMQDWTRGYAENVVRTNAATAHSAGRFRQMARPAVARAIAALRFSTAGDVDVRLNHRAADGLVAAPSDPVWPRIAPPLGFQCRCQLDFVSWPEARRMGIVQQDGTIRPARMPRGAHPDARFRHTGRPDIAIYAGSV